MNEKQVEILNENLIIKDKYIAKQDSVIKTQIEKVESFESSVMAQNDVNNVNLKTIENLNLAIKKQNKNIKVWKILVLTLLVGIVVK